MLRRTLMEMAQDRGFIINEAELEISDLEPESLFFFDENLEETDEGINLQEYISQQRNLSEYNTAGFLEIYKNEENDSLLVYVAPETYKTKSITKNESNLLSEIISTISPQQMVVVTKNDNFARDFINENPSVEYTFFLTEELQFNPSYHNYAVEYTKVPSREVEGRKSRLTKRLSSDVVIRYFGYRIGDVLLERTKNQGFSTSLVNDEVFYVLVVR